MDTKKNNKINVLKLKLIILKQKSIQISKIKKNWAIIKI